MTSATPVITNIDPQTLREWMSTHTELVIIDVRSAAEFASLHIKGSYHVPLPLLNAEGARLLADRLGQRVVLVCQSGVRAEQARSKIESAGIGTAMVLTGGVPGFDGVGGDVVRGTQRWELERQVRMAAGSLVVTGLLAGRLLNPKARLLSAGIGAGLAFSAATNSCAMGQLIAKMPWNRAAPEPTAQLAINRIPNRGANQTLPA